ncbi:hypothetical protein VTI74DRAFT_8661 [Chaetomium olivicolor]
MPCDAWVPRTSKRGGLARVHLGMSSKNLGRAWAGERDGVLPRVCRPERRDGRGAVGGAQDERPTGVTWKRTRTSWRLQPSSLIGKSSTLAPTHGPSPANHGNCSTCKLRSNHTPQLSPSSIPVSTCIVETVRELHNIPPRKCQPRLAVSSRPAL